MQPVHGRPPTQLQANQNTSLQQLPTDIHMSIASFLFSAERWFAYDGRAFFQTNRYFRQLEKSFHLSRREETKDQMINSLLKMKKVQGRLENIPPSLLEQMDFKIFAK